MLLMVIGTTKSTFAKNMLSVRNSTVSTSKVPTPSFLPASLKPKPTVSSNLLSSKHSKPD